MMLQRLNRREALVTTAGGVAACLGLAAHPALAANDYAAQIEAFTQGRKPVAGDVKIVLPELAENGNTVPLSVAVMLPEHGGVHVEEILVVAPMNPNAR